MLSLISAISYATSITYTVNKPKIGIDTAIVKDWISGDKTPCYNNDSLKTNELIEKSNKNENYTYENYLNKIMIQFEFFFFLLLLGIILHVISIIVIFFKKKS